MYSHSFEDLDGHVWELVYMDPKRSATQLMTTPGKRSRRSTPSGRIEAAKIIAGVARLVRDVGPGRRAGHKDALVAALEHWPESGVPNNPGAWFDDHGEETARSTTCAATSCSPPSTRRSAMSSKHKRP